MSSNSNLGYGGINPYNMSSLVNGTSSNNPATFSSNEVPGLPGLAGAKSNIDAAAGNVPGICNIKGGAKKLKRKIKNITKRYKMKGGKKSRKVLRKKLMSRSIGRTLALTGGRRRTRHMKSKRRFNRMRGGSAPYPGGYGQYQNNLPMTNTYQVAGVNLPANQSALANPPPATALSNCTNCVDNYNHYTNSGFPSRGN